MKIFLYICLFFAAIYSINYIMNAIALIFKIITKRIKNNELYKFIPFWYIYDENDNSQKAINTIIMLCTIIGYAYMAVLYKIIK